MEQRDDARKFYFEMTCRLWGVGCFLSQRGFRLPMLRRASGRIVGETFEMNSRRVGVAVLRGRAVQHNVASRPRSSLP